MSISQQPHTPVTPQRPKQISPHFSPQSNNFQHDLIFLTEDSVLFYVQTDILRRVSGNVFKSIIAQPSVYIEGHEESLRHIPDRSVIFTMILHAVYSLPYNDHTSFQTFAEAVIAMQRYDIEPALHLTQTNPFYDNLLSFAPSVPFELYVLAAQFDIYHLAAAASSHLLSYPIVEITEDMAERIGGIYMKRLLVLHRERMEILKSLLLEPPKSHSPTDMCDLESQARLAGIWVMGAGDLAWTATPGLSGGVIRSTFDSFRADLTCQICKQALDDRVQDVVARWSDAKCTI